VTFPHNSNIHSSHSRFSFSLVHFVIMFKGQDHPTPRPVVEKGLRASRAGKISSQSFN
jgi:hypothetical protein